MIGVDHRDDELVLPLAGCPAFGVEIDEVPLAGGKWYRSACQGPGARGVGRPDIRSRAWNGRDVIRLGVFHFRLRDNCEASTVASGWTIAETATSPPIGDGRVGPAAQRHQARCSPSIGAPG